MLIYSIRRYARVVALWRVISALRIIHAAREKVTSSISYQTSSLIERRDIIKTHFNVHIITQMTSEHSYTPYGTYTYTFDRR